MNSYIYLRVLKHVDYSVFCVTDGQKTYNDPLFDKQVPYSSGQQVKRSIIDKMMEQLNQTPAPVTFISKLGKDGSIGEGEAYTQCNPEQKDLLIGGWMQSKAGGTERTLKRRSPLSISAMTPLHSLLVNTHYEKVSYDRSDKPELHTIIVRDQNGNELTEDQIQELLKGTDRSLYRKFIQGQKRATGLFTYDVAIDLRTLFCVSTNQHEPEVSFEMIEKLKSKGWKEVKNVFGNCLVMPKEERDKVIPALAKALINWHITSNQARTFSLMETLAVAISDNANSLAAAIRAKLIDDGEKPKAKPIVDKSADAKLYVTLPCSAYMVTESESATALDDAEKKLEEMMNAFDFEQQLKER